MQKDVSIINKSQRDYYAEVDRKFSRSILDRYIKLLEPFINNSSGKNINILDVGGGAGYFLELLYEFLQKKGCNANLFVLDTMEYENWKGANKITFIEGSATDCTKIFEEQHFDIIFCNKVFHHFVVDTWQFSLDTMHIILKNLNLILKDKGKLCILDIFYNGYLVDEFPSKIIFKCTTNKNKWISKLFKKLGAASAGVGVCFQSEKMWYALIQKAGYKIEKFERGIPYPMKRVKQIFFLSKKPIDDNIFILRK